MTQKKSVTKEKPADVVPLRSGDARQTEIKISDFWEFAQAVVGMEAEFQKTHAPYKTTTQNVCSLEDLQRPKRLRAE